MNEPTEGSADSSEVKNSSEFATGNSESIQSGLSSRSFIGLLATQLLTGVNDNVFRWLVIGLGKNLVPASQVGNVLMAGTACFVMPYLLLAAPAGYLADRFNKRNVIVACKIAEILIMALGMFAIISQNLVFLMVVVTMMGAQSALFSPAKLGSIPEILPTEKISAANGLFGLTTVIAAVIGMGAGSWLSDAHINSGSTQWFTSAVVLIGLAIIGTAFSLIVRTCPPANPTRKFPWNAAKQTFRDIKILASNRAILRVALGLMFFWSVGALAQMNIDQFAAESGGVTESDKVPLLISLICGVAAGSVLAGVWSGGRIELGILPIGAVGVAVCSMLLFMVPDGFISLASATTVNDSGFFWACLLLFALGTSAGLFDVPLESYMQHRSPIKTRGSILAASNVLTFGGVLLTALAFGLLRAPVHEGSVENIPASERGLPLEMQTEFSIDKVAAEFESRWSGESIPDLAEAMAQIDQQHQAAALSKLLPIEFRQREKYEITHTLESYTSAYPDHRELIPRLLQQSTQLPLLSSRQIFLLAGFLTLPVLGYILFLLPQASIRFLVWLASKTIYRIRVYDRENLPEEGGALLVANHVSWLDGVLLLLTSSRPIRMVVYSGNFRARWLKWLANLWGAIMISSRPKEIVAALGTATEALNNGELVCVFPEGGISRTGQLQAFKPGVERILVGTDAPVVPVYIDEMWGSIFSFEGGRFFWKWPKRWPYPISIFFGKPIQQPINVQQMHRKVQEMGTHAMEQRKDRMPLLTKSFIRECKRRKYKFKIADSTGTELTGGQLLARTLVLRKLLKRHVFGDGEQYIGLLLPPSIGGSVANLAVSLDRRVAVNLNYTVSSDVMNACIKQANISHVLTSKKFMDKMNFELDAELVYLEDLKDKPTALDKLTAGFQSYILPRRLVESILQLGKVSVDGTATVIFTSGSTGVPKGVMLSYANIASNSEAIRQIVHINPDDVIIGLLPLFHSLGYTVTHWTAMSVDMAAAYHHSPLDSKALGKLCEKYKGTILLTTPTFLRSYTRRCTKEQLETLDVVVAGAEKLPKEVADAFEEKFGTRPVEGYGATELAPLASVNIPNSRAGGNFQALAKEGTVGRPIPGVTARIVDLDSDEELGHEQSGMLQIKGANVMKGYLDRDDLTEQVIRDGWYVTGDIAEIDKEGFIKITGRQSRFSKIGGEMVPHLKIEESLSQIIGGEELKAVVTAVPDAKKGERLIVIHTELDKTAEELCEALRDMELPNLFIPSADGFHQVDEIPILGTGKLDLKGIKQVALEQFGD